VTTRYEYQLFGLSFFTVAFCAFNSVLSSAYLPDILNSLADGATAAESANIGALINFAFLLGAALGGIMMGFVSDRVGRRVVLALSLVLCGIGSGGGAVVTRWDMLLVTRALVGTGVGAALVASTVLIAEEWRAGGRTIALGVLSVSYPVGIIASGIVTASVSSWRSALGIGALVALFALPVWRYVRESTRWIGVRSQTSSDLWRHEPSTLLGGMIVYGTMLIGLWSAFAWLPTWVQSLVSINAAAGQQDRGVAMVLFGGGGMLGGLFSGVVGARFGVRRAQLWCFVACGVLSYFLFYRTAAYSVLTLSGIATLGVVFGISQGVLNALIPSLFPTAIASAATGLCFHAGRVFTAFAVFFVGTIAVRLGGYGSAIFAFSNVYVIGFLALVFLPVSSNGDRAAQ
jgi:predicted MFS family arabinose efflux permease